MSCKSSATTHTPYFKHRRRIDSHLPSFINVTPPLDLASRAPPLNLTGPVSFRKSSVGREAEKSERQSLANGNGEKRKDKKRQGGPPIKICLRHISTWHHPVTRRRVLSLASYPHATVLCSFIGCRSLQQVLPVAGCVTRHSVFHVGPARTQAPPPRGPPSSRDQYAGPYFPVFGADWE
ncbi:hypothetical protein VTK73DRAFT_6757 [Phialemonium thermophilum]|uniref:Uncharacterized protein n=1 Tax=Phialemonium thermophilum TaxID=223376 RepID=A0ABR3WI71_9PEZI